MTDKNETVRILKAALKAWYRERAKAWWSTTTRSEGICDDCNGDLKKGEGYLRVGNYMCCEPCTDGLLDISDWDRALQNIDAYFGPGIPHHIRRLAGG